VSAVLRLVAAAHSFIVYGVLMEYATTEGRKLHEMSLIFVTRYAVSFAFNIAACTRSLPC
jgi:hypothetical protein